MSEVVIRHGEQEMVSPVVDAVEGESGFDISNLRSELGLVTLDRGFGNTAETPSEVSFIDGAKGILRYRGYNIEDLASKGDFLEICYLLSYGELPTAKQLDDYRASIDEHIAVREDFKRLFESFPETGHPMQILASGVSLLSAFYPDALKPRDPDHVDLASRILIAKVPSLIAWIYRYRVHLPYVYPWKGEDYIPRFLRMIFEVPIEPYVTDPVKVKAMNMLLILHADHGQNCSSSAVRLVGSGEANICAAVASGIHALSGPLHGGANQSVLEMLEHIREDGGDVSTFVARAKDKDDSFRLMGFGHRVYKNFDPRALIIKSTADELLGKLGVHDPLLEIAKELEETALSDDYFIERKLFPNVDFYSGILYRAMGFKTDFFTVLFALGRLPGWLAQFRELANDPKTRIFRPRQVYVGSPHREWVPIEKR